MMLVLSCIVKALFSFVIGTDRSSRETARCQRSSTFDRSPFSSCILVAHRTLPERKGIRVQVIAVEETFCLSSTGAKTCHPPLDTDGVESNIVRLWRISGCTPDEDRAPHKGANARRWFFHRTTIHMTRHTD